MQVAIIGVYFGKFPTCFSLWLHSCKHNPDIQFYIFTDAAKEEYDVPDNVHWQHYTLQEMRQKADQVLGFATGLTTPYKCCDFKVLYGLLFEEYLKEYDYWGCCDFDLIWGDLKHYMTTWNIAEYERFLPLGHLSLYRNTPENNQRFKLSGSRLGDYRQVYSIQKNVGFDEDNGLNAIYEKHGLRFFTRRVFADISNSYSRFRCARKDLNYKNQVFFWRSGKTYRAYWLKGEIHEEEFMYVHFQKRGNLRVDAGCMDACGFFITNTGFYPMTRPCVTLDDIHTYNPCKYPWMWMEQLEKKKNQVLRHLKPNRKK